VETGYFINPPVCLLITHCFIRTVELHDTSYFFISKPNLKGVQMQIGKIVMDICHMDVSFIDRPRCYCSGNAVHFLGANN